MNIWLDDKRGALVDWITQKWVILTGKRIMFDSYPWLEAPMGKPVGIGRDFYELYARENRLRIENRSDAGLLDHFGALDDGKFDVRRIDPQVADFYERTSSYEMDAWSEWCSFFKPFGLILSYLFSKRLQQLNVPLSPLDTAAGVRSKILKLSDPDSGKVRHTAWVRELIRSDHVIYAGSYSTVYMPGYGGTCIKVAFPLPNGNALVIMKPEILPDGSFQVTSAGRRFGDPGFYFTLHDRNGKYYARYVRSFRESIRVYVSGNAVRADHVLTLFSLRVLHIHYKLTKK